MATDTGKKQVNEFTEESVRQLRALGGQLTDFEGSMEELAKFQPEKFEVTATTEKVGKTGNSVQQSLDTTGSKFLTTFSEDVYTQGAIEGLRSTLLPAMQARLASIRTQRDQPGRSQLLSTSLLG